MTFRHLQIFIVVAECGSMRAAAKKLYLSQPSVSQAVKELEEHFDVILFERLNQRIYITDSGRKLLNYARYIVDSVNECEEAIRNDKRHPVIRIGSSVSVGTVLLENYLENFEAVMPEADTRITVNNTETIEKLIMQDKLDLAIVEGNVENDELCCIVIDYDELLLVVGPTHKFYESPYISIDMLDNEALISREDGSMLRNQYEQYLRDAGVHMIKKWNCTNILTILNSVAAGRGIGMLSSLLVSTELKSGELKVLNVDDVHIKRPIRLIYHKNKYLTDAMKQFCDILQSNKS